MTQKDTMKRTGGGGLQEEIRGCTCQHQQMGEKNTQGENLHELIII